MGKQKFKNNFYDIAFLIEDQTHKNTYIRLI